jgi:RNA polymerase sigma-70 factor (ECF subfamily)
MGIQLVAESEIDPSILEGCRQQIGEAQRRLFEHYKDRVFSIALHFLKGDETTAQDVAQDVFVKVFRAAPSFRKDARVSTWLYRIVANTCTDELRRRRRFVPFADFPDEAHRVTSPRETIEHDPDVVRAIHSLSPKLRMAVLLRYYDDLTYDEIAGALGVTQGTVASRLNRAHTQLARKLAHLEPHHSRT